MGLNAITWNYAPLTPWNWLVWLVLAGLLLVVLAGLLTGRWREWAQSLPLALVVAVCTLLAGVAFGLAVLNPLRQTERTIQDYHLAVVLDVSESVLRDGRWREVQERVVGFVDAALAEFDATQADASASIVTFGAGTLPTLVAALDDLPIRLMQLDPGADFAPGTESDIEQGLQVALDEIASRTQRGEILLVTDGNQTRGDAQAMALVAARQGIAITVLPLDAGRAPLSISALALAPEVRAQENAILRGVLRNRDDASVPVQYTVQQNPGLPATDATTSLFGVALESSARFEVPATGYVSIDPLLSFQGVGVQFADVWLYNEVGVLRDHQRRFTHVVRPVRVLAYGNSLWARGIAPDVAEIVAETDPGTLETVDLTDFDAVVISGLPARNFPRSGLRRLAEAIPRDGLGLWLINGPHVPADPEDDTVLKSYEQTPLADLLPLDTTPRQDIEEQPRHIIIMMDTSGSMRGWPLQKAQQIARYIIQDLMRPFDTLDVVTFTTGAANLVDSELMTPSNRAAALNVIDRLSANGGTDPTVALRALDNRILENCGLIFISDGEFRTGINARPDCRTTAFGIGSTNVRALAAIADPFVVDQAFNPRNITIPYFEQDERNVQFEVGNYVPRSLAIVGGESLFVPNLSLDGNAITYRKPDAHLIANRPLLTDPVLAYRDEGLGTVGELTTGIPDIWTLNPDGRQALQDWLMRTVGYFDRDRYAFDFADDGEVLTITIEVKAADNTVPDVGSLAVDFLIGGQTRESRVEPLGSATFRLSAELPRTDSAQQIAMVITESGNDQLPRPQRVPLLLPAAGSLVQAGGEEANSQGTNRALLERLAAFSGGQYDPAPGYTFFESTDDSRVVERYWPYLLALGATFYLAAIGIRRLAA